jgi:hypothetical protein
VMPSIMANPANFVRRNVCDKNHAGKRAIKREQISRNSVC